MYVLPGKACCRKLYIEAVHSHRKIRKRENRYAAKAVYREKAPVMGKGGAEKSNRVFPGFSCDVYAETLATVQKNEVPRIQRVDLPVEQKFATALLGI